MRSGAPKGRAPQSEGRRWRRPTISQVRKWGIRIGVVVLAVLAAFFAVRIYLDRQWYVGEADGHVAVYQGIPATFGGLRFSHVEEETDIPASAVAELPQYPALSDGITANDRTEAEGIVEQIRRDLTAAAAAS